MYDERLNAKKEFNILGEPNYITVQWIEQSWQSEFTVHSNYEIMVQGSFTSIDINSSQSLTVHWFHPYIGTYPQYITFVPKSCMTVPLISSDYRYCFNYSTDQIHGRMGKLKRNHTHYYIFLREIFIDRVYLSWRVRFRETHLRKKVSGEQNILIFHLTQLD